MKKYIFVFFLLSFACTFSEMPSNFNNQQALISRIEQYIDLIKNLTQNIMNNPIDSPQSRSDLVTSVLKKDNLAEKISEILCQEFLQKYISPDDPEAGAKQATISRMLNICFLLKTRVDVDMVKLLEDQISEFKRQFKLNYKIDPNYKPLRYRKYRSTRKP